MKWIIGFSIMFLFACSIYSSIIIHNNTNNNISCRILKKPGDEIIEFAINKGESRKYLFRSNYNWTIDKINEYIETIDRIELIKETDTLKISSKNDIMYLLNSKNIKRKKRKLIINIDENFFISD